MHTRPGGTNGPISRREAMAAGLAAAGLLALGRDAAAGPAAGAYGPFKMGLQSYSLRGLTADGKADVTKALKATRDLGVTYWESYVAHVPVTTDAAKAGEWKTRLSDAGVSVIGYGVVHLSKNADEGRKFFEFAKLMGIEYLSADPEPDSFETVGKLAEEYGVNVGIHNHGPGHRYDTIDKIAAAIKDHSPRIGCCVDTGHFLRSREDPVRAVEVFGKRTYGVHLKDVKDATQFTVLGKGDLKTADLLTALAKIKYPYCLALEYEENPADPIADLRACLAATREVVKSNPAIGG